MNIIKDKGKKYSNISFESNYTNWKWQLQNLDNNKSNKYIYTNKFGNFFILKIFIKNIIIYIIKFALIKLIFV